MKSQFTSHAQVGPTSASAMRVPNRSTSVHAIWGTVAQMSRALQGLRDGNQRTSDLLTVQRNSGNIIVLPQPHPFKIYSIPSILRPTSDPATDWLKFRVRSGMVGDMDVDGTDESPNPDSHDIPLDDISDEITATSGMDQFFFWIELSSPGGVKTSAIKSGDPNTNGWTDYPDTDGRFILIGWVNTTDTTNQQVDIRQLVRADILKGIETADCGTGGDSIVDYFGYRFDAPP